MIICEEKCEFLEAIASKLSPRAVELVFVDDDEMRGLNLKQRGMDESTDVLSFPLVNVGEGLPLGSVVINKHRAADKARELGHSLEDEIALLFIHALLHLLGFDHEKDSGQMRQKEGELVKFFKLPPSLIVRSEADA
ncbi:rRNA maturation RNase YbeY [Campylobacter sp.]|uniref:rRNA maturation RNase YbeY n=1 Tax=Campylobacter sp. TaxID=205 RepID=UPI0026DC1B47|nr:rRNA maturation RNase YbeY [Campylobacter sp.]MDO4674938.1 rRNA maturation RNase YbeY [Campylobacter sp.]